MKIKIDSDCVGFFFSLTKVVILCWKKRNANRHQQIQKCETNKTEIKQQKNQNFSFGFF